MSIRKNNLASLSARDTESTTPKGDIDHEECRTRWIWGSSWSLNEVNGEDSGVDVSSLMEFAAIPPENTRSTKLAEFKLFME